MERLESRFMLAGVL